MKENHRKSLQERKKYLANTYSFDVLLIDIYKIHKMIFSHTGSDETGIRSSGQGIKFKQDNVAPQLFSDLLILLITKK
ncbi:hypothetical protein [Acetivibrio saccincola]|uniref:Uncharacterized protein n=1 Tax=Acetivibrio saccincola TaxID=1677857 RepID=A0A2K9DZN8_9FIRM|nr:hypothetical protein [Acetivibrio saccincola]AUG56972.1 hypothetical protein HVS_05205 [Acetivibrio saccincola]NLW27055.1 hypothetical protein [Acetivibrio saccincola]PQQ66993.1 hypothetical protein B9R14_09755 [Acetivibrio saccincola]HOA98046.1 hypothetical protein [Acetivibrio saccincola]